MSLTDIAVKQSLMRSLPLVVPGPCVMTGMKVAFGLDWCARLERIALAGNPDGYRYCPLPRAWFVTEP